ncbi:MAG: NUDIX hydrolase [candidate division Zixibacteria bacterium]|nr:NUDIX hydrolase [candidate division Zixibacteria bacterium]
MEPKKSESNVIFAAGGLVTRQGSDGLEVAIIQRSRYGKDWCLPKGKQEVGESLKETALREVKEELGFDVKITSFAGMIHYEVKGIPKYVFFWRMIPVNEDSFIPSEEVAKLEWLIPVDVIKKLSYEKEKNLLSEVFLNQKPSLIAEFTKRIKSIGIFPRSKRLQRLSASQKVFRKELECYLKRSQKNNSTILPCAEIAFDLLGQVNDALEDKDIESGWRNLNAAKRMLIHGLEGAELKAAACLIREESDKLRSWRKRAVYRLIGSPESPIENPDNESVYQAAYIRNEAFNTQYHKIDLLKSQLLLLFLIYIIALAILVFSIWHWEILIHEESLLTEMNFIWGILLFGLLGGTVSAIMSLAKASTKSKIPEQISSFFITLMRVFLGAGSALVISVFLASGIFEKVFVFKLDLMSRYLFYAISFAAGFSERLILKAVESVTGKK